MQALLDAVFEGANHSDIEGVEVESLPAFAWARDEADENTSKAADAYLFIIPANFGYTSGALK